MDSLSLLQVLEQEIVYYDCVKLCKEVIMASDCCVLSCDTVIMAYFGVVTHYLLQETEANENPYIKYFISVSM